MTASSLPNVWVVRASYGQYTNAFLQGGYCGIGYVYQHSLTQVTSKEEIITLYKKEHPEDTSNSVIGIQAGQVNRFLFEMQIGDTVVTPAGDNIHLYHGVITGQVVDVPPATDDCPFRHRRTVKWANTPITRQLLSIPLQNTLRSSLTIFGVSQKAEFYAAIGQITLTQTKVDPYRAVLERVLTLSADEFEILVGHLLTALGFDGSEVTGKPGDGGVDARGELNVSGLASIKIFVQAKRYQLDAKIAANTVKQFRSAIPSHAQGAFITTANYQSAAYEVASEAGFPRIGLINGHQLVDLLVEHWMDLPEDFRNQLGLRPGLVIV
jgi:restriction system protein